MSFNTQPSDSLRPSSSSSRYQSPGERRDREHAQRDRANTRPSYGGSEVGVPRGKQRSSSTERVYRSSHGSAQSGSRLEDRAHGRRDYGLSGLGMSRYSGRKSTASGEPPRSPFLSSSHKETAALSTRPRDRPSQLPAFSRRSTEPAEALEEGELEADERNTLRLGTLGHRTFTMPADRSKNTGHHDSIGAPIHRNSRPSSSLSTHSSHESTSVRPRSSERKHSQSFSQSAMHRHDVRQTNRDPTPSPKREKPSSSSPSETLRSPLYPHSPRVSRPLHLDSLEGEKKPKVENSSSSQSQVPRQELHSRISDIDREIAECQEKLVMISGSSINVDSAMTDVLDAPADVKKQSPPVANDRAVPTLSSHPQKPSETLADSIASKTAEPIEPTDPYTDPAIVGQNCALVDSLTSVVPQSGTTLGTSGDVKQDGINATSGSVAWQIYKSSDIQVLSKDDISDNSGGNSDSDSDEDGLLEVHPPKDKLKSLVSSIYRENQIKAAEMQTRMATSFLTSYPTFVPGSYPSPTDWPFWKENVKIHEKVQPHLTKILGREKNQNTSHSRKLQEEYSELYSKWRKRVDKLDRQREAKQRSVAVGAAASGAGSGASSVGGSSGGSQPGSSFASTSNRRRHVSGSSVPTTDEFGFSLGPLFSASTNLSSSLDTTRRADDFLSDAVHSEAELQAIIERLQHDDARNPDLRSQRTAATIPNMVTDPKEREALRFNNSCHLVTDPMSFYHARLPEPGTTEFRRIAYANNGDPDNYWTQSEVSAFVAAFLTHPKQFGKIASYIPYKTMNDCVLFYYRNKKPLRLKELETKSNKRVRRSRQAGVSSGGAGGRRRKERARERRERRVREEREKLAQEAAAGCAPVEYSADVAGIAVSVEDGQMTNVRTSAAPSDDEGGNAIGDTQEATAFSPEEVDVLERRSRSSALLRSIIAANRQRKSQAAIEGSALLGFGNNAISDDSSAQILSPMNDGDDDDDVEDESPMSTNAPDVTPVSSRRGGHHNGIVSAGKARRKPSGNQTSGFSASGPLSPISPSIPVSSIDSRSRQDDYEEDGEATSMFAGSASRDAVDDEIEEGEERGSLRTGASGRVNISNSEDDDGEEEGELVEDSHWEPRRPSRLYMELSAYAMGGSIVRTRRGRELDRERFGGDDDDYKSGTDGSDDGLGSYSAQRDRKASLAELSYDEEDEVVEASGIISGHGSGYQAAGRSSASVHSATGDSKQQPRPRIVSRRSQSRFGATLTAVLDPYDSGRSSTTVEQGSDASAETSLYMLHRQGSHQRYALPRSPSATSDRQRIGGADLSSGDPPKESALDRYVINVAAGPKRPISSYEALFMCSPSSSAANAGVAFSIHGVGALPESETGAVSTTDPGSIGTSFNSQRRRLSASPSSSKKQLEARIDEEAGAQNSVLVGAAVWLREDRKRVLRGLHKLGPDFAQVASLMPSKSMAQCRYFYYHYRTPTGTLISEIIPNSLTLAAASASAQSSDSKHGGSHSGIGSLVLPQTGMQPSAEVYSSTATKTAAHSNEQRFGKSKNRSVTARMDTSAAQGVSGLSLADAGVGVKRQRTKSPVSQQDSSSDDEDDETPLAAQLAEELAAQATVDSHSHPGTPILGTQPPIGVNTLATQQRRASELLAQARPELINPRVTPISSLVLPPKTVGSDASNELNAGVKGSSSQVVLCPRPPPAGAALVQGQAFGVGNGSGIHGVGRTPSPHLALPQAGGGPPLTAKKSGYSSYWSVHERSAFMHFVVRLGPDWSTLAEAIGSKTGTQVRNYFRANREKLALDAVIAEYEKNKAGGTLPPMTPFQPVSAASVSSHSGQSAATGAVSGSTATTPLVDDAAGKKEKRGRKRKNDRLESPGALSTLPQGPLSASTSSLGMSSDSIPLSQINRENMANVAISPNSAATGKMSAHLSQTPSAPNTAPATMTSFPTIGIDGGRAVVYTRVLAPAGDNAQQQQPQQPHQTQVVLTQPSSFVQSRIAGRVVDNAAVRGMSLESGERQGSIARAESDTMSSQATPPPVEGLPRLSSSPAPGYGALHISNLMTTAPGQHSTVSSSKGTGAAFNSAMHSATDQASSSYAHQSTGASRSNKQEEREVRVTKINALLNDDSPTEGQSTSATDWFGASETPVANEMGGASKTTSEEEATGIAALALASMMGVGRLPTPTAPVPLQQRPQLPPPVPTHSQQHQHPQHQQPPPSRHPPAAVPPPRQQPQYGEQLPHHMHSRHSPMPPHSLAETYVPGNTAIPTNSMEHRPRLSVSSVSVSAFSPSVVARGSPMAMSPPPATHHHQFQQHQQQQQHQQHHYHHLQARPSSVGPVPAYHPQHGVRGASDSPAIPTYSREMSPLRVAASLAQGSSVAGATPASRQRKPSAPLLPLPPTSSANAYARGNGRSSISSSSSSNYAPYNVPQHPQQQQPQPQQMSGVGSHGGRIPPPPPPPPPYSHVSPSMQHQLPASVPTAVPVSAPMPPPVSRVSQYSESSHYNAGYAAEASPQATMAASQYHYQPHMQQQQQQQQHQHSGPSPYYYPHPPNNSNNNPPPSYR